LKFLDEDLGNLVTFLLRKAFEEYVWFMKIQRKENNEILQLIEFWGSFTSLIPKENIQGPHILGENIWRNWPHFHGGKLVGEIAQCVKILLGENMVK
jgi:hypothetical protein